MQAKSPGRGERSLATLLGAAALGSACATTGAAWLEGPSDADDPGEFAPPAPPEGSDPEPARRRYGLAPRSLGAPPPVDEVEDAPESAPRPAAVGRSLGTFRNTYYDFPAERDFEGALVELKDARCKTIGEVPRGFHDAVCVQGSGMLANGSTISFAKRDCECAAICPRTSQRICFEALDPRTYPWGRGATGGPITPLLTVAVDSAEIPLGTPLYIPEYDGLPRDEARTTAHDGCFLAQDRGSRVRGKHVDVFTGHEAMTRLWNQLVPSNRGVTVLLESPRCARGEVPAEPPPPPAPRARPKAEAGR
ncbi:MAG: hypothetical protein IT376_12420 [Polyangiaceae bacterium]|nr:hypothetical protein [Polyangiaceae bacterium]